MTIPKFFIGAWQVPTTDIEKWQGRGVNDFFCHVDHGGAMTKAEWERQVTAKGGIFTDYPGADVTAEGAQPNRRGFLQLDEPDLSNHVDTPGNTPAELDAKYQSVKPTGLPMFLTVGAMDNQWYDGFPKPQKTDGSKYGHRAEAGGWLKYADIVGFDFYIYTHGRTSAQFNVIKRLLDRSHEWSGNKKIYLFIESCTQGRTDAQGNPRPMTADQFEEQVWHAVDYCGVKGYALAGIIYFSHKIWPQWGGFDITTPEVAERMKTVNAKLNAKFNHVTPDPVAELEKRVDAQAKVIAAHEVTFAKLRAALE